MGRFNGSSDRRHLDVPPHQRGFQRNDSPPWHDNPPSWRDDQYYWNREERHWRGSLSNREQQPWRKENSSRFYRGRHSDRDYHSPPNQVQPAAVKTSELASERDHISNNQSSSRANWLRRREAHHNSKTMGKEKSQASQAVETSTQDATDTSQEMANLTDYSDMPSSKPKRKRSNTSSSSGNIEAAVTIFEGVTADRENRAQQGSDSESDVERTISAACTYLKLDRGQKLVLEASSSTTELTYDVPCASSQLTRRVVRYGGFQNHLWDSPEKNSKPTTMVILDPVLDEAPDFSTETLAQEFIRCPDKRWLRGQDPKLCVGIPYYEKYFIWARIMLLDEEDRKIMDCAEISRGVFSSLFYIPTLWPLIQAFLDFWNVKGHTIVTSQGEMGYSLLLVSDAMGIPISGHAYDEFVPLPFLPDEDEVVKTLHGVFAKLCKLKLSRASTGNGLVRIEAWLDYFLADKRRNGNISEMSLPCEHYAPVLDPLLRNYGFHVAILEGKNPSALFSGYRVDYRARHSRVEYRAAFIATWLCMYCVPMDGGMYIRPEVFTAAASIARGRRKAVGIASLANLYSCLDNVYHSVVRGEGSASECDLPLPVHFIMGWFAAYWNTMSKAPTCPATFIKHPPFVVDCGRASHLKVDIISAHKIFLVNDIERQRLRALDFIGRQGPIHFARHDPFHLNDSQETHNGRRSLKASEIDLIISSMVGGVCHRRCQLQNNQVYCPHRFARSHNCDQEVPDIFMDGKLQFSDYLKGTLEETTKFLTRRLLGYLRPGGHNFELMPRTRPTHCSYEYMKWRTTALSFLQRMDIFAATIDTPDALENKARNSIPKLSYSPTEQVFGATPTKQATEATESLAIPGEESSEMVPNKKAKKTIAKATKGTVSVTKDGTSAMTRAIASKQSPDHISKSLKVSGSQSKKSAGTKQAKNPIDARAEKVTPPATPAEKNGTPARDIETIDHTSVLDHHIVQGATLKKVDNKAATADIEESPDNINTKAGDGSDHSLEIPMVSNDAGKQSEASPSNTSKNYPKKSLKGWNTNRRIGRLNKIVEEIQGAVQQYVEEASTAFNSNNLPSALKKFDQSPGVALYLPESADAKTKLAFQQIVGDLKALQALANAEDFSPQSFLEAVTNNLDVWVNFFSASFTEEVQVMITKLQSLRKELDKGPDQQPHDTSFAEQSKQVDQLLEKAISIDEQLAGSQAQVEKSKLAGEKQQEVLDSFQTSLTSEIQVLEMQLASKKESLEFVQSQKTEMLNFFQAEEAVREAISACSTNLKAAITKGNSLSNEIHEFKRTEDDNNDGLLGPVQALRNLVKAYRIEE